MKSKCNKFWKLQTNLMNSERIMNKSTGVKDKFKSEGEEMKEKKEEKQDFWRITKIFIEHWPVSICVSNVVFLSRTKKLRSKRKKKQNKNLLLRLKKLLIVVDNLKRHKTQNKERNTRIREREKERKWKREGKGNK